MRLKMIHRYTIEISYFWTDFIFYILYFLWEYSYKCIHFASSKIYLFCDLLYNNTYKDLSNLLK